MGLSAFIPVGEIADALVAAGSKALDAIAPGLSDAIANGLSGINDLIGALSSKATQLASKISGDQEIVADASSASNDMNGVRLAEQLREEKISAALGGVGQTTHGVERLLGREFTGEDVVQTLKECICSGGWGRGVCF